MNSLGKLTEYLLIMVHIKVIPKEVLFELKLKVIKIQGSNVLTSKINNELYLFRSKLRNKRKKRNWSRIILSDEWDIIDNSMLIENCKS